METAEDCNATSDKSFSLTISAQSWLGKYEELSRWLFVSCRVTEPMKLFQEVFNEMNMAPTILNFCSWMTKLDFVLNFY